MVGFKTGNIAIFSFNGTDISAYTESVSPTVKRDDHKLPRIGGNAVARLVGEVESEFKVKGWFDSVVDTLFTAELADTDPTAKAISWQPQGADGTTWTGVGQLVTYDPDTDASKPGSWSATISVDGAITF